MDSEIADEELADLEEPARATVRRVLDQDTIREPIRLLSPRAPLCLAPDASLQEAVRLMREHHVGCVLAVVLFARYRGLSILSLGDITCAAGTIGIFLGRIANFINGELWGRPSDVPWAMVFPTGGPLPRHPSQLYEAALEGLLLFALLTALIRAGALKRPGFILGAFTFGYALARSICEQFREPDPQLGFLWGSLTMGTLLSLPLMLAGIALMAAALRRQTVRRT